MNDIEILTAALGAVQNGAAHQKGVNAKDSFKHYNNYF